MSFFDDFFGFTTGNEARKILAARQAELAQVETALQNRDFNTLHKLGYASREVGDQSEGIYPAVQFAPLAEKIDDLRHSANQTDRQLVSRSVANDYGYAGPVMAERRQAKVDELMQL